MLPEEQIKIEEKELKEMEELVQSKKDEEEHRRLTEKARISETNVGIENKGEDKTLKANIEEAISEANKTLNYEAIVKIVSLYQEVITDSGANPESRVARHDIKAWCKHINKLIYNFIFKNIRQAAKAIEDYANKKIFFVDDQVKLKVVVASLDIGFDKKTNNYKTRTQSYKIEGSIFLSLQYQEILNRQLLKELQARREVRRLKNFRRKEKNL